MYLNETVNSCSILIRIFIYKTYTHTIALMQYSLSTESGRVGIKSGNQEELRDLP